MATVQPYHSGRLGAPKVHHDQDDCWDGNNIETYHFKWGTGGFPLCQTCQRIKAQRLARYLAARRFRRP